MIKSVGKGAFGEVFLASKKGIENNLAVKKISKKLVETPKVKKYFNNEIYILKNVNHPNIIKLYEIKQTLNNYYLVFDLCNGGGLSNCLEKYMKKKKKPFTEEIVQHLMRQIVSGLQYLHNNKILHRDIKLDNILVHFENDEDLKNLNLLKSRIKIIDFGFARYLNDSELAQSILGSPINMDPHILAKMRKIDNNQSFGYDEKADIWSLGTICYEMLVGSLPFDANTYEELQSKINKGDYKIPSDLKLSQEAISFINGMLQYDYKARLDVNQLANHIFLQYNIKDFSSVDLGKSILLNAKQDPNQTTIFSQWGDNFKNGGVLPESQLKINLNEKYGTKVNLDGIPEEEGLVDRNQQDNDNNNNDDNFNYNSEENQISKKNTNTSSNFNSNINIAEMKSFILNSFDIVNKDFFYMEPMLIPIVPNTDQKALQLDI